LFLLRQGKRKNKQREIMTTYIFDGSLEGLLTALFEFYARKETAVQLVWDKHYQPSMLDEALEIINDEAKAKRVWDGLKKKLSPEWRTLILAIRM
jgi:hypothetical protein